MSKMSKAIAVLGVVAGLGVAALPLSSYAADGGYSVGASTKVTTEVEGSISIAIQDASGAAAPTIDLGKLALNGAPRGGKAQIVVSSNNNGAQFDLTASATEMTATTANGTFTIPKGTPAQGTSAWGAKVFADKAAFDAWDLTAASVDFTGFNSIDNLTFTSGTTSGAAENQDATATTYVGFGASAAAGQEAGNYSSTVTFTASVK